MIQSNEFFIHKDNIVAFADLLAEYQLKNEIGYSTGDGVSVTVWYDIDDEHYGEYIEKLEALDDE